jgi:hypothetical protein
MKHSTYYSFAKSPGGNLGRPGDSFKTQMKHSTHYSFAKRAGGNLAGLVGLFKITNDYLMQLLFCKEPRR